MTRRWLMVMGFACLFGGHLVMSQTTGPTTVTLPGVCLKWLHIAEAEMRRKNLDLDNYTVTVVGREETATVIFKSVDASEGSKGSGGSHVGYEVEIRKKDSRVLRSNYVR